MSVGEKMAGFLTEFGLWRFEKSTALRSLLRKDFSDFTGQLLSILVIIILGLGNSTLKTIYIKSLNCGRFK